jgi:hypothetical protein
MTQKEFIEVLDEKGYSYGIEGDKIIVTHTGTVHLESLREIPTGVWFNNDRYVLLDSLKVLPTGVRFNNRGYVLLEELKEIHAGVQFNNGNDVYLQSLKEIHASVQINNRGDVYLVSLIGGWLSHWKGNLKGVNSKGLLNHMINKGIFER